MTDQHRLSGVGAYGPTPCRTPTLDALAREGTLFRNAYCPTPMCSPTRASLMTGMMPHRHGVSANIGDLGCMQQSLADTPDLLSRRLEAGGYRLGYTGKWHICAEVDKRTRFQADYDLVVPSRLGFEGHDAPGHGDGGFELDGYRRWLADNNLESRIERTPAHFGHEAGVEYGPEEATVPWYLASHTIDLIDRFSGTHEARGASSDQPWFIWHNFWGPHAPYITHHSYADMYEDVAIPPWPDIGWNPRSVAGPHQRWMLADPPAWSYWEKLLRSYYAFATQIDANIGRIVSHLRAIGELDNTIIIFAADHGESLGGHGGLANKGCLPFEETLQVPLIMRGPGIPAGAEREALVSNLDLYETACAIAGAPPATTPGILSFDLTPVLADDHPTGWRDQWITESHGIAGYLVTQRILRWGDWSYAWAAGYPEMLWNLRDDPHQMNSLADSREPAARAALVESRRRLREEIWRRWDPPREAVDHYLGLAEASGGS
jgi:arylsulfatase A-like enzyme